MGWEQFDNPHPGQASQEQVAGLGNLFLKDMLRCTRRVLDSKSSLDFEKVVLFPKAGGESLGEVLVGTVLELEGERALFHFEDSQGRQREGWLSRNSVPLGLQVGQLLQVLVLSRGLSTRLMWLPFEPPTSADYRSALQSLPSFGSLDGAQ